MLNAQGMRFTATLDTYKIQARPGQTVNRVFRLTLDKDEKPTQMKLHTQDWWSSEDGKQSFFKDPGTLEHSCAKWTTLEPAEVSVEPGGNLEAKISVAVPAETQPGGYWCVLTVDQLPDPLQQQASGIGIRFLASISVGIFVYVDPVERIARITEVDLSQGEARVALQNDGNCPLGVDGRLEFFKPGEMKAPVAVVVIGRRTVLTEPVRRVVLKAILPEEAELPAGDYLVRAILDIGVDHYIGAQKRLVLRR
jgi:hypothetical protein